ncbi:hypothetical protein C8Q79DRAFT_1010676 [Trametes meyenii]|nr:hypothetical protein C8Q79DRAFT_1010676 [Trametes meyenii]
MVKSLGLLRDAPVDEPEFSGNLKAVLSGLWHLVFDSFPNRVTGRSNVRPDRGVVCPRLGYFHLRYSIDDPGRLDAIIQCFECRARHDCPLLKCLDVKLFANADWSRDRAECASEQLLLIARHVHLSIHGPTQSLCATAGLVPPSEHQALSSGGAAVAGSPRFL